MIRALREEPVFAERFLSYLLARTIRMQEDVVDQLFHSSQKRLARVLLSLAHFENDGQTEAVIPKMSQDVLAVMIGTTRSSRHEPMSSMSKEGAEMAVPWSIGCGRNETW
jgi:CRP-like cAMP-binding protein